MSEELVHKVVGKSFVLQGKKIKCNQKIYWQGRVSYTWKNVTCPECLQCRIDTATVKERRLNKIGIGDTHEHQTTSDRPLGHQWF